jgi:hypothetical protein
MINNLLNHHTHKIRGGRHKVKVIVKTLAMNNFVVEMFDNRTIYSLKQKIAMEIGLRRDTDLTDPQRDK